MKILGFLICSLALAGLVFGQDAAKKCNCYYTSDCGGGGKSCGGYGDCTGSGKSDGTCSTATVGAGGGIAPILSKKLPAKNQLPGPTSGPDDIYSAVDGYFQAFLQAVNHGGGVPDPQLIRTAQKTLESESSLNDVEYGVWVSMDAVMGWDFMYPNKLQRT